jgi:DNA-binding transcriptional regulator YiaG
MLPSADEIRATRERARLTRAAFSALIGVSEQTLKKWETGKARPTPVSAERYRAALGKIMNPFGGSADWERWRMIREKAGFTTLQMALAMGADEDEIIEWETPRRLPTVEQRSRYEDLLRRIEGSGFTP